MKRTLLAAGATLIVACSVAVLGFAADNPNSEEGKTEGKAPMYSARCSSPCNFSVRSHDKAEVAAVIKEHAKSQHQKELSDQEAQAKVKEPKK